ncbi:MAG: hypothetical protein KC535_02275 [Nanoarchaeota archaeon]|nr:hypothetical protein [Nanoarchaeota archaeon]
MFTEFLKKNKERTLLEKLEAVSIEDLPRRYSFFCSQPDAIQRAVQDGFIKQKENKILFLALDKIIHNEVISRKYWIHKGFMRREGTTSFDNYISLETKNIFGDEQGITYLSSRENSDVTLSSHSQHSQQDPEFVTIYVNPKKLIQLRSIFHDPEMIDPNPLYDVKADYGNTFFVFGGIPKEAIIKIEKNN